MKAIITRLFFGITLLGSIAAASPPVLEEDHAPRSRWAFEYGIAFITSNTIDDLAQGRLNVADGPAGGEIHILTASWLLGEQQWNMLGRTFRPTLEVPLDLAIVDENGRSPFRNYSASFQIRWQDFPWNHLVSTSVASGVGLAYSERIFLMDIQRHPDRERSHLKFNWPIQLTLALPQYPQHQLTLFVHHQSGGHIFDRGGVNSIGLGYRRDF